MTTTKKIFSVAADAEGNPQGLAAHQVPEELPILPLAQHRGISVHHHPAFDRHIAVHQADRRRPAGRPSDRPGGHEGPPDRGTPARPGVRGRDHRPDRTGGENTGAAPERHRPLPRALQGSVLDGGQALFEGPYRSGRRSPGRRPRDQRAAAQPARSGARGGGALARTTRKRRRIFWPRSRTRAIWPISWPITPASKWPRPRRSSQADSVKDKLRAADRPPHAGKGGPFPGPEDPERRARGDGQGAAGLLPAPAAQGDPEGAGRVRRGPAGSRRLRRKDRKRPTCRRRPARRPSAS